MASARGCGALRWRAVVCGQQGRPFTTSPASLLVVGSLRLGCGQKRGEEKRGEEIRRTSSGNSGQRSAARAGSSLARTFDTTGRSARVIKLARLAAPRPPVCVRPARAGRRPGPANESGAIISSSHLDRSARTPNNVPRDRPAGRAQHPSPSGALAACPPGRLITSHLSNIAQWIQSGSDPAPIRPERAGRANKT